MTQISGPTGLVWGPVGQSRTVLVVGSFAAWAATIETHVFDVARLGAMQGRAAEPATIAGAAEGWREHPWFWGALSDSPQFEVELIEVGRVAWRFPATVQFLDNQIRFKSIGQAKAQATGG